MAKPHVTLISGPQGTGKTIYAQALKTRLTKHDGKRVLVIEDADAKNAYFKEEYASGKWDNILLTTTFAVRRNDFGRRINIIVRISRRA